MEAGQATWNLYAMMCFLERRGSTDPAVLQLTGLGRESCRVVAEHMKVPLPTDAELQSYYKHFESMLPSKEPVAAPDKSAKVAEALDLCAQISDGLKQLAHNHSAAEFHDSLYEKVTSMQQWVEEKNHVTDKMLGAFQNMKHAVDKWLERNEDDDIPF